MFELSEIKLDYDSCNPEIRRAIASNDEHNYVRVEVAKNSIDKLDLINYLTI